MELTSGRPPRAPPDKKARPDAVAEIRARFLALTGFVWRLAALSRSFAAS
jgi:hypothetical protein